MLISLFCRIFSSKEGSQSTVLCILSGEHYFSSGILNDDELPMQEGQTILSKHFVISLCAFILGIFCIQEA